MTSPLPNLARSIVALTLVTGCAAHVVPRSAAAPVTVGPITVRPITLAQAQRLAAEVADPANTTGFAGVPLPPRERGWLLGVALDMAAAASANPQDTSLTAQAHALAERICAHLDPPPENPPTALQSGCAALVPADEVADCRAGLAAYRARRDE